MLKTTKVNSGVYLLELHIKKAIQIKTKRFLGQQFPKGYYYYSGSAQKNLSHRLERHIRKNKIIHWHIDHLTSDPDCEIKAVFIANGKDKNLECEFVDVLLREFGLKITSEGFGNGDCHTCNSHLLYSKKKIDHNHFISLYQSIERFIPSSKETF